MDKKNKSDKILFFVAIIVILIALINLGVTFYKFGGMNRLTGHATIGTANLSIVSLATVNFTTNIINWGSGVVTTEMGNATIASNGTMTYGNWTTVSQGLTLQNDGNCNVKLNLTTSNTATTFIGGGGPLYFINVSANESGSCVTGLATEWSTATGSMQPGCWNFTYYNNQDVLDIDVMLRIPQDAVKGAKGSTITATATVID